MGIFGLGREERKLNKARREEREEIKKTLPFVSREDGKKLKKMVSKRQKKNRNKNVGKIGKALGFGKKQKKKDRKHRKKVDKKINKGLCAVIKKFGIKDKRCKGKK